MGPRAFFETSYERFQQADRRSTPIERVHAISGLTVRLRFAGPALVPAVVPAIAHTAIVDAVDAPSLTVCFWDSASTGVSMPAPPWSLDDYQSRTEIRGYRADGVYTAFQADATILSVFDVARRIAIYWVRDASRIPYYERGAPCRSILNWWLSGHGRQAVHAAAVGGPDGCVLLAGRGGSGKSNTALLALGAGLSYLGDDYCIATATRPPIVHTLYCTGKTHAADLDRLAFLAPSVTNSERLDAEKALCFLNDGFRGQLIDHAPLAAVLMPHVGMGTTRLRPASPLEALLALGPSTTSQLPYAGREVLETLSAVVRQVPCYHLDIGADAAGVAPMIASLLKMSTERAESAYLARGHA